MPKFIHLFLCGCLLQLTISITAQTHYFAYSYVVHDTLKIRDSTVMSKLGPINVPMKATGARCFVYYSDIIIESDSTLHPRFSKISTTDKVLYPAGIKSAANDSPPIKVYDLKNNKYWDNKRMKGYMLVSAAAPKAKKRKDGKLIYKFNDACYVITDPVLSTAINPGIMWKGMQGGVVEIKTVHYTYELIFHAKDNETFVNKVVDSILEKLKTYTTKEVFVPYLFDTQPRQPKEGQFKEH